MRKRGLFRMVSLFLLSLFLMTGCGGGGGGGGSVGGGGGGGMEPICPPLAVARNNNGKGVVAYLRDGLSVDKVYVNYYNGQSWLGPILVSEQNPTHPEVAISDNGDAIVVWAENRYIKAKLYKNGWSENYTIAGPYEGLDSEDYSVAMYSDGRAIVVWSTGKQIVKREYNSANNAWDNPVTIYDVSSSQLDGVSDPIVAIDKDAQPKAHFVWLHAHIQDPFNPDDYTYQEILYAKDGDPVPTKVWKMASNFLLEGHYLKPTSLMVTCAVMIGIHHMEVVFPVPPNTNFTITTRAYVSINPNGYIDPTPISNPRTATTSVFNPNSIPAPWVGEPLVVMDNQCNAIGVWQEQEGLGDWQDHIWLNVYKNSVWSGPKRITEVIEQSTPYLASYDPVVDFVQDGIANLVYAKNTDQYTPGYFATKIAFTQNSVVYGQPVRLSRNPTLILTEPGLSKGLAVWVDSETINNILPDTVFGRFYNPLQDSWSDIIQIGD